ncbi:hypothetical protein [Variovorax paradoxus]|uniref:hypothetical protein n=1 Tax=Variovorax paradoxus TaxID=34073 RepID=UPI0027882A90|nr:hypothetical protein [Variovorax paradoxus]MDP9932847.1 hypothetical protein [Variovorax paradoxus]
MSDKKRLVLGAALCATALIALGLVLKLNASEWASWVQALGSIFAIAATGWAVNHSHALSADKATDDADEVRKLSAIASCIFHCRAETESLKRYCPYKSTIDREIELLGQPVKMLRSISALEIPDWRATVAVGQAMSMFSYLVGRLQEKNETIPFNQRISEERVERCTEAITKFEECERLVQAALKERGADVPRQQMQFADGAVLSVSAVAT